jgi:hypothetical protein
MKYFLGHASTEYIGTDETWKIKAENEQVALDILAAPAMSHIDSFGFDEDEEDSLETEREYNYWVEEITEEEFNESDAEELTD